MSEKKIQIGGQAVIEGVMMRGPEHLATAVRRRDGSIEVQKKPFISITKTHPIYKRPVIRGFVSLIEMMKIGIQTLNYSADIWEKDNMEAPIQEEGTDKLTDIQDPKINEIQTTKSTSFRKKMEEYLTYVAGFGLAILLFGFLPYWLASLLNLEKNNIYFNLFSGSLRIVFFVIYVYCISFMKEIKRVFEYHGAEHKAVFAYEQKAPLTVESVKEFITIHPRCGTSFMFIVLLIAILIFSIIDTFVAWYWNFIPNFLQRFLYHLPFIPLISGISYEFLKLSEKKGNNILMKLFTKPGMALQNITTQPPDELQIEVAIVALKEALNLENNDTN
ncbi:MAG: DUF1385 domain-containing protein [Candidatus Cloacimonetes bacterium]|nr:DUF1385 domain-containing protein [Candidatus Cloacimonadota bacterium]